MKKNLISKLLISTSILPIVSTISLTSCSNNKQDQKVVESTVLCNEEYFETVPAIPTIYQNNGFSFTFKLKNKCYINKRKSYVISSVGDSHAFNGRYVDCVLNNDTYTVTVSKDIVTSESIVIYISTYKELNVDTSSCSTTDFDFETILFPSPIEGERYTCGFKILNNKGLDVKNSKIYIGGVEVSRDYYSLYESEIDSTIYTFISISSALMVADVKLDLKASEYVTLNSKAYPEYSLSCTSSPVKNNDFTCYLTPSGYGGFVFDKDNIVIKVDDTTLTSSQYTFDDSNEIATLTIASDVIKTASTIYVDVPIIECYTCYACKQYENPTVEVMGDSIIKNKQYVFKVHGLDDKDILWDDANTYIRVNDKKLTKANNDFTVSDKDPETGYYTVTVKAEFAIADMYCHFITENK